MNVKKILERVASSLSLNRQHGTTTLIQSIAKSNDVIVIVLNESEADEFNKSVGKECAYALMNTNSLRGLFLATLKVKILNEGCPNATFIPEIWQGHKNNGEGFWIALEKLENVM
jgi:hypothetical protein